MAKKNYEEDRIEELIKAPRVNEGTMGAGLPGSQKYYGLSEKEEGGNADTPSYGSAYKPGQFSYGAWDSNAHNGAMNQAMDAIKNQKAFAYDVNADALYQQYKNQYLQQGKLAMMDSMAQASAMAGGYGNSYAANVGNQAYQSSMQQLNNVIPELYEMAYGRYQDETNNLYNRYALEKDAYDQAYGEWQQGYSNALNAFNTNESMRQYEADQKYKYDVLNNQNYWNAQELALQKAQQAQTSTTTTGKDKTYGMDAVETDNTKRLEASLAPVLENMPASLKRYAGSDKNPSNAYNEVIEQYISKWLEGGRIDENEATYLMKKYGIIS